MGDRNRSRSRDRDRRRDDRDSHRSRGDSRGRGRDDRDRRDDRGRGRDSDRGRGRDSRDRGRGRDYRDGRDDRDRRDSDRDRYARDRRDRDDDRSRDGDREEKRQSPVRADVGREEDNKKSDVPDWVRDLVEEPRPPPPVPASQLPPMPQMGGPPSGPVSNPGARTVIVPQQFVSKVLGFGGCTVNEIQLKTKTYIKMNQDTRPQGYSTAIITSTLYNDVEALDKAEAMIRERIDSGMNAQSNFQKGGGKSTPGPLQASTFTAFAPPVSGVLPQSPGPLPVGPLQPGLVAPGAMGWTGPSASPQMMMGGGSFL